MKILIKFPEFKKLTLLLTVEVNKLLVGNRLIKLLFLHKFNKHLIIFKTIDLIIGLFTNFSTVFSLVYVNVPFHFRIGSKLYTRVSAPHHILKVELK